MSSEVTTESGQNCANPDFACAGNANEQCGGSATYDFYAKAGATTIASVPSSTGFTYVMDSFIVESVVGISGTYNYVGCLVDPSVTARALNGANTAFGAQTVNECANYCAGYTYFGLEDGGECFCGDSIDNGATYHYPRPELNGPNFTDPDPTAVCSYNGPATAIVTGSTSYTYYGPITTGSTLIDVITTGSNGQTTEYTSTEYYCDGGCNRNAHTPGGYVTATNYPTATPTDHPTFSGCSYIGCYDDNGGPRTLNYAQTQLNGSAMTQELCVSTCLGSGYPFAGVEYGSRCFCGQTIAPPHTVVEPGNVTAAGITLTCTDPDYACTGDDTEQCGGFATMDIWHCTNQHTYRKPAANIKLFALGQHERQQYEHQLAINWALRQLAFGKLGRDDCIGKRKHEYAFCKLERDAGVGERKHEYAFRELERDGVADGKHEHVLAYGQLDEPQSQHMWEEDDGSPCHLPSVMNVASEQGVQLLYVGVSIGRHSSIGHIV
ncbi:hypothetical protein LTR85_009897 [Meristemomyces frigidus]|nr:hypothetical protein LTR85_009897 [Meristemomyces frigidus]